MVGRFALGTTAWPADTPSLKDAFKGHSPVGTAVKRVLTTGQGFRRSPEQVNADIALVQAQFNQLVAENDMKWALIHPRPGPEGYDFGLATAFVNLGLSNQMELARCTLVGHTQTPNSVFALKASVPHVEPVCLVGRASTQGAKPAPRGAGRDLPCHEPRQPTGSDFPR